MSYRVEVLPSAVRSIRKLPPAAKKLAGRPEWRVRTGGYRIIYCIQDEVLLVVVVEAGH